MAGACGPVTMSWIRQRTGLERGSVVNSCKRGATSCGMQPGHAKRDRAKRLTRSLRLAWSARSHTMDGKMGPKWGRARKGFFLDGEEHLRRQSGVVGHERRPPRTVRPARQGGVGPGHLRSRNRPLARLRLRRDGERSGSRDSDPGPQRGHAQQPSPDCQRGQAPRRSRPAHAAVAVAGRRLRRRLAPAAVAPAAAPAAVAMAAPTAGAATNLLQAPAAVLARLVPGECRRWDSTRSQTLFGNVLLLLVPKLCLGTPLVPKLCLGTYLETLFPDWRWRLAKRSFADVRSQTEFGNEL